MSRVRCVLVSVVAIALSLPGCNSTTRLHSPTRALGLEAEAANPALGSWQDQVSPDYFVLLGDSRLTVAYQGQVRNVAKVLAWSGSQLRLCENGRDTRREIIVEGDDATIRDPEMGATHRLHRLSGTPRELILQPLTLPELSPLPEKLISQIQREIRERFQKDQEVLKYIPGGPVPKDQPWLKPTYDPQISWGTEGDLNQAAVLSDNTRYLKEVVSRVGWIDVPRFGYATANSAFFLVQHSGDLSLMLAALPGIKADVDADRIEGDAYAYLYDRLQLALGEKQLYGSQVFTEESGEPALQPVESPDQLDELRAAQGMGSALDYLRLFGGHEVRISKACSG